jgi:hypothetical protein
MKGVVQQVVLDTGAAAQIQEIDITGDPGLEARYGLEIPVLLVNGKKAAKYRVSEKELTRILLARVGETEKAG